MKKKDIEREKHTGWKLDPEMGQENAVTDFT